MNKKYSNDQKEKDKDCFVIMPIAGNDSHGPNHFRRVYEDIITPACDSAGYKAVRADDVKSANLIHLDILKKTIQSPLAICDLSTRNPNVMFELGVRQAFDMPVVLIKEIGTPDVFDIGPLRYLEYCQQLRYNDVIETQKKLASAISDTVDQWNKGTGVNSIVKLLSLTDPAKIPDIGNDRENMSMKLVLSELNRLGRMIEGGNGLSLNKSRDSRGRLSEAVYNNILESLTHLRKEENSYSRDDVNAALKNLIAMSAQEERMAFDDLERGRWSRLSRHLRAELDLSDQAGG